MSGGERGAGFGLGGGLAQHHEPAGGDVGGLGAEADVPRLGHGADVELHVAERLRQLARPGHGFVERRGADDVEAGGELVAAREGAGGDLAGAARGGEARAQGRRAQALAGPQDPRALEIADQRADVGEEGGVGDLAGFPAGARLVHDDESHRAGPRLGGLGGLQEVDDGGGEHGGADVVGLAVERPGLRARDRAGDGAGRRA